MDALTAEKVNVLWRGTPLAREVCFRAESRSVVGVIGPNGAGKSSLLKALAGLFKTTGDIRFAGAPLPEPGRRERARLVGYLPQSAQTVWPLTVREITALGRLPYRSSRWGDAWTRTDGRAVADALARMDLADIADRPIVRLSGGERARAMLARVLAGRPRIVLADEPVAALDPRFQLRIMDALRTTARRDQAVILAVLHDLDLAARCCDRLILMERGRVVADGAPPTVLRPKRLEAVYRTPFVVERAAGGLMVRALSPSP